MNELDVLRRFREDIPEPSTAAWVQAKTAIEAARADAPVSFDRPRPRRANHSWRGSVLLVCGIATVGLALGLTIALANQASRTPGTRAPTEIRARVVDALSAETNTILHAQSSIEAPGHTAVSGEEWDYPWNGQPGQVARHANSYFVGSTLQARSSITFRVPAVSEGNKASGLACNIGASGVFVDFMNQTWHPYEQQCVDLTPDAESVAFVDPKTHQPISDIRTIVADGLLHVVGYPSLKGQPTIELKGDDHAQSSLDLWVDARTYLPVQVAITSSMNQIGDPSSGQNETGVTHFSFLNPTPSNLANLDVPVPPGFKETASSDGGTSTTP